MVRFFKGENGGLEGFIEIWLYIVVSRECESYGVKSLRGGVL